MRSSDLRKIKVFKGDPDGYFKKHLELINPFLPVPLTPKEVEVLSCFMSLSGNIVDEERFGTTSRKYVKKTLNLSDGGLSNYIMALRKKGFIRSKDGIDYIPGVLLPNEKEQIYMFKLVNNV